MTKNFLWVTIEKIGSQSINFITQLILARILLPEDFGLVAMVAVFIAIARSLVDSGIGMAIIQFKDVSENERNTAFTLNLLLSVIMYLILFFCAPTISSFYNKPILINIIRYLGFSFIAQSFFIVPQSLLVRDLNFKRLSIINIVSALLAGIIGFISAVIRKDVYALVIFQVASMLIRSIGFNLFTNYKLCFNIKVNVTKKIYNYSIGLLLTGLLNEMFNYAYVIVIGKVYSDNFTGQYNMANTIVMYTVVSISLIVERISIPILSKNFHSNESLQDNFYSYSKVSALLLFPILLGIISTSQSISNFLFTSEWDFISIFLRYTALNYLFFPITIMFMSLMKVIAKTKDYFLISLFGKGLTAITIILTVNKSLLVLLQGSVIVAILVFITWCIYMTRESPISIRKMFYHIAPFIVASVSASLTIFMCQHYLNISFFITQMIIFALAYVGVLYFGFRKPFLTTLKIVSN